MVKTGKMIMFFLIVFLLEGCQSVETEVNALYPKSEDSFVGDPMPYFNGEEFMMYYLEDLRDGQIGFHPFSLMTTNDFYHYKNVGEVIPYVNEEDSAERALGTGSIIQDETGIYHAFYTGHNGERTPKEVIMHASSKDGKNWQKIPEDTFQADDMYEKNDFRDPYVFYEQESQEYWMLITTRQDGQGIIAKYTSNDLRTWKNTGSFFNNDLGNDSNLECPSLVYFNEKWYLAFSDQWDKRVVHYRVADRVDGPFRKSTTDHVDGAGFYAGRLETDGENLYQVGWIPTKENHDDLSNYNWAGNLAVHQLKSEGDKLIPQIPKTAYEQLDKQQVPTGNYTKNKELILDGTAQLLEGTVQVTSDTKVALEFSKENIILLDFGNERMQYYNTYLEDIPRRNPQSEINLTKSGIFDWKIVKENEIVVIYFGDYALSNRMYEMNNEIKMIVLDGQVTVK
ncbi:hypothetical protein OMQ_00716 [Enterococcus saccharolyticus subsp. saccharolyticus ATCC 43076]|uniref:beta-fructofuranosidase n=1 Tax=Enterococcus saccharolyticus subsp. saccharolyticus ATCC 43076 TaxID=1139996 RepID=S0NRQ6_9ENTE|nr:hypothetical protein OMQ_00716 [Enterococcus saccharolyticus subsp. saccharolyticus ATCC 43076]EOT80570.1 hypothetical protein I572_01097 [Enterococcus saccharolyticus subsp. saccharolyticus ATCC 43076]